MQGFPDPYNAFLDRPPIPVRNAASGPLEGLRLAVKDIFDVKGWRTGGGNPEKLAEATWAAENASAVQVLLDAGARFVGKTQMDELAFAMNGQNVHFPFPVNPAAPQRITGGSSSGSAAAVAGGLAEIALGSDTGGSIRAPASYCGLIGLRPTHGRIATDGVMPLAPSFDTVGWFASDIEVYEAIAKLLLGRDSERRPFLRAVAIDSLDDLVLGEPEAAEYRRMTTLLPLGIGRVAWPFTSTPDELYWCFRQLQSREAWDAHGAWIREKDRGLAPGIDERFGFGATVDNRAVHAESVRRLTFRAELTELLPPGVLLVLPTVPGAAPLVEAPDAGLRAYRERALHLLCLSGLSGFPQISIPAGTVQGAPFGLSLLGPPGTDIALIRLGRDILKAGGKA
jgi:amidase